MSKTIEVISRTKGTVSLPVNGESRSITFEDKGDVGIAMCDHDEAAVLLRVPGYWKAGASTESTASIVEQAVAALDGEAAEQVKNIKRGRKKAE